MKSTKLTGLVLIFLLLFSCWSFSYGYYVRWKKAVRNLNGLAADTLLLPFDLLQNARDFLFRVRGDTVGDGNALLKGILQVKAWGLTSWQSFNFSQNKSGTGGIRPCDNSVINTLANYSRAGWFASLLAGSARIIIAGDSAGQAVKNCSLEVRVKR